MSGRNHIVEVGDEELEELRKKVKYAYYLFRKDQGTKPYELLTPDDKSSIYYETLREVIAKLTGSVQVREATLHQFFINDDKKRFKSSTLTAIKNFVNKAMLLEVPEIPQINSTNIDYHQKNLAHFEKKIQELTSSFKDDEAKELYLNQINNPEVFSDLFLMARYKSVYASYLNNSLDRIDLFLNCLETFTHFNDVIRICRSCNRLSQSYSEIGDYKTALYFAQRSLTTSENSNNIIAIINSSYNLAKVKFMLNQLSEGDELLDKTLIYCNLFKSENILEEYECVYFRMRAYEFKAKIHVIIEKYEKAREYVTQALKAWDSLGDQTVSNIKLKFLLLSIETRLGMRTNIKDELEIRGKPYLYRNINLVKRSLIFDSYHLLSLDYMTREAIIFADYWREVDMNIELASTESKLLKKRRIGINCYVEGQFQEALDCFSEVKKEAKRNNAEFMFADVCLRIADIIKYKNNFLAVSNADEALKALKSLYQKEEREYIQAILQQKMGIALEFIGEYNKAILQFEKAALIFQKADRNSEWGETIILISEVLLKQSKFSDATKLLLDFVHHSKNPKQDNIRLEALYHLALIYYGTSEFQNSEELIPEMLRIADRNDWKFVYPIEELRNKVNIISNIHIKFQFVEEVRALFNLAKANLYTFRSSIREWYIHNERILIKYYRMQKGLKALVVSDNYETHTRLFSSLSDVFDFHLLYSRNMEEPSEESWEFIELNKTLKNNKLSNHLYNIFEYSMFKDESFRNEPFPLLIYEFVYYLDLMDVSHKFFPLSLLYTVRPSLHQELLIAYQNGFIPVYDVTEEKFQELNFEFSMDISIPVNGNWGNGELNYLKSIIKDMSFDSLLSINLIDMKKELDKLQLNNSPRIGLKISYLKIPNFGSNVAQAVVFVDRSKWHQEKINLY